MAFNTVRKLVVPETSMGTCLWEIDGKFLSDGDGFLSMEGVIGDLRVETKMCEAAAYWLDGELVGKPKWIRGARKISDDEWEDQQARFEQGLIPDPVEELRQALARGV